MNTTQQKILDRYGWKKVHAPQPWRPQIDGEELVGFYGGRTIRTGSYGQYEVTLVHVPHTGSFTVTGSALIRLLDAAQIGKGHPVRVVWRGLRVTGNNHTEKQFELLVADMDDVIDESDLPEVRT